MIKKFLEHIMLSIVVTFVVTAIVACGPGSNRCAIEGHFLKMNQGRFFVYSLDDALASIDTVSAYGGRFDYEVPCDKEGILVFVFPNFSELPVFVEPGASVSIEADATHIKDIEVSGTKANKLMTKWRKDVLKKNPDETIFTSSAVSRKYAEEFIKKNPSSIVSHWMLYKYFISDRKVPRSKVRELVSLVQKANGQSLELSRIKLAVDASSKAQVGDRLPQFTAKDINGNTVSSSDLMRGDAIITVWTTWNYDGQNMNRLLKIKMNETTGNPKPKVVSICFDASVDETRNTLKRDTMPWPVVNDQLMWESPLVSDLGLNTIPDNIVIRNGKIIARHIEADEACRMLFGK